MMSKKKIDITKNIWLEKLKEDTTQNIYNLKKHGLYIGELKNSLEHLKEIIDDFYY